MAVHGPTEELRRELYALIEAATSYVEQIGRLKAQHRIEIRRQQEETRRIKASYEAEIYVAKLAHEERIRILIEEHRAAVMGPTDDLDGAEEQVEAANLRVAELGRAMDYLHRCVGAERQLRQEDVADTRRMVEEAEMRAAEAQQQADEANRLAEQSYKWAQAEKGRAERELARAREAERKLCSATQDAEDANEDLRECKQLLERLIQTGEAPRRLPGVDELLEMAPGKIELPVVASSSSSSSSFSSARRGPAEPLGVRQEPPFAPTSFKLLTETHGVADLMNMENRENREHTSALRDMGRERWLPMKVEANVGDRKQHQQQEEVRALAGSSWRQTPVPPAFNWQATQASSDWKWQASGSGLKRRSTSEKAAAPAEKKRMDVHIWDISSDDEL
ncbi:hypothetical protein PV04_10309 [Phialophora macrospora]|uniref:Uncharacterized protein n=1 Tax=Phialophora macrospora TaxID=1851006 RepID=A0A0D2F6C8_9EURO|nr:hypothetical protein PV04_10309 [Phialophora macrospora]